MKLPLVGALTVFLLAHWLSAQNPPQNAAPRTSAPSGASSNDSKDGFSAGAETPPPTLPDTSGSLLLDAQEWPLKPGPRQIRVWINYPERSRLSSVNAQTGIILSLHNWGGTNSAGTANPNTLAQRYNLIAVCVDYLQSGAQASIHDPEPYDYGYLQALDALRALHFVFSGLKARGIPFDSSRLFSTGGSGGGNVSLMANKFAPRTFAAIIDLCGMPKLTDTVAYNLPGSGGLTARYTKDPSSPNYLSADAQEIRFAGHPEHLQLMRLCNNTAKVIILKTAKGDQMPEASPPFAGG